ncbi:PREDICTED: uncharacterized protein LOC101312238 [Fragaria vesca subsp. vesca]
MEVYVDDMVVKSLTAIKHVSNLQAVFDIILAYSMRLNPDKCLFGAVKGKFVGHVISRQGIEANPEKVQVILNMEVPKVKSDVQSLTGKITTLARFVSRLTDKCALFFKLLKSQHCKLINWGLEQEEAFRKIKEYLASVLMLSKPIPGEMLYLYLAAFDTTVSLALIKKDDVIELPVYYVGKGFTLAESRYPDLEKLALALIVTAQKLQHYFQAHSITLFTNCPLRQVLEKPEASGRLAKWAIKLGEFDIHYVPRVAMKGQTAADFISELTPMKNDEAHPEIERQALAKALLSRFESATVTQIPRKENSNVDAWARLATGTRQKGCKKVKVEILDRPSISKTILEIFAITVGPKEPTWIDPIIEFIKEGVRPENRRQARKLQLRCARYTLIDDKLYRRGYYFPNLKCVSIEEGETILRDIHGVCGNYSGSRSLIFKAQRTAYFWPNIGKMADQISVRCHKCHQHANKVYSSFIALSIMMSPWPFAQWGLANREASHGSRTVQKLREALWAIRTTPTESTGEMPFSLAFGTEAVIPIELTVPSGRVEGYNEETNAEGLQLNMDLIEEKRERVDLHNQVYKQRVSRHYDSKVRP